jgi:hypothetical protein
MGDRPKKSETLAGTVTRQLPIIDWPAFFARQQANMDMNSLSGPCPVESFNETTWYNWTPGMNPPVPASQAVHPEKFLYYPPPLPKEWDLSLVNFQQPQIPPPNESQVGGPIF